MTTINLLPWRETLRKERQQKFMVSLGAGGGIAFAIVAAVHLQINTWISAQDSRNQFLSQQIERVEKQIDEINELEKEKQRLLARMNVIQQLQQGRPQIVHVFDELVRTLPDGVYLSSITQSSNSVAIQGFAQSNARISAYMRNLDASEWLANPKLSVIEAAAPNQQVAVADRTSKFTLNISLVNALEGTSQEAAN